MSIKPIASWVCVAGLMAAGILATCRIGCLFAENPKANNSPAAIASEIAKDLAGNHEFPGLCCPDITKPCKYKTDGPLVPTGIAGTNETITLPITPPD